MSQVRVLWSKVGHYAQDGSHDPFGRKSRVLAARPSQDGLEICVGRQPSEEALVARQIFPVLPNKGDITVVQGVDVG